MALDCQEATAKQKAKKRATHSQILSYASAAGPYVGKCAATLNLLAQPADFCTSASNGVHDVVMRLASALLMREEKAYKDMAVVLAGHPCEDILRNFWVCVSNSCGLLSAAMAHCTTIMAKLAIREGLDAAQQLFYVAAGLHPPPDLPSPLQVNVNDIGHFVMRLLEAAHLHLASCDPASLQAEARQLASDMLQKHLQRAAPRVFLGLMKAPPKMQELSAGLLAQAEQQLLAREKAREALLLLGGSCLAGLLRHVCSQYAHLRPTPRTWWKSLEICAGYLDGVNQHFMCFDGIELLCCCIRCLLLTAVEVPVEVLREWAENGDALVADLKLVTGALVRVLHHQARYRGDQTSFNVRALKELCALHKAYPHGASLMYPETYKLLEALLLPFEGIVLAEAAAAAASLAPVDACTGALAGFSGCTSGREHGKSGARGQRGIGAWSPATHSWSDR
ncbi:hypothetical protein WJX72_005902 [[Myrmecia] bisecta]|uniref:Uncharacterized protein n=1 Tax=[Myrmecia] bisecta TaxID=41462 RepID=A0AAW1R704_9CHLO